MPWYHHIRKDEGKTNVPDKNTPPGQTTSRTRLGAEARVREAAGAGTFYPRKAELLQGQVRACLAEAGTDAQKGPKAIIGPHAGYVFSGPIAGSAYAPLVDADATIRRVVLIGPSHYVSFPGIATPSADAFATPLGTVHLRRDVLDQLEATFPQVTERDDAHEQEHGLEVHLPFLQSVLEECELIPLVTGKVSGAEVAEVLDHLWGGAETLIAVSSDLSHYYDYASARERDQRTSEAILALDPEAVEEEGACGRVAIQGLLHCAKARGLRPALLDLRNSGDTAGNRDRVVGYGAYAFYA